MTDPDDQDDLPWQAVAVGYLPLLVFFALIAFGWLIWWLL